MTSQQGKHVSAIPALSWGATESRRQRTGTPRPNQPLRPASDSAESATRGGRTRFFVSLQLFVDQVTNCLILTT
jgi:hypothetical protein